MATGALIEEVADNLEEAAEVTRRLNPSSISFFLGGAAVGAAVGFYFGYRWNKKKIRAEVLKEAEAEIEEVREIYRQKTIGKVVTDKPSLDDVVQDKGYSPAVEVPERPTRPSVPVQEPPAMQPHVRPYQHFAPSKEPFAKRTEDGEKDKSEGWSYPYELSQRASQQMYIIHQDEFTTNETQYQQTTYTYYAGDDVLTDEHDTVLNNRENLIGDPDHLTRFGHGTDDLNVLYIRNVQLELEFEICRTPKSYEEEVLGLNGNDQTD